MNFIHKSYTPNNSFKPFSLVFLLSPLTVPLFLLEVEDFSVEVKTRKDDRT